MQFHCIIAAQRSRIQHSTSATDSASLARLSCKLGAGAELAWTGQPHSHSWLGWPAETSVRAAHSQPEKVAASIE